MVSFVGEEYMAEKSRCMVWVDMRAGVQVLSWCDMEIVYDGVSVSTLAMEWMVIVSPLCAGMGFWRMSMGFGQFVAAIMSSLCDENDGPFG